MLEQLRPFLYPLGLVANLLFGVRFFVQWIQSEKQKASVVTKSFWRLSFVANTLLCVHSYLQGQYPVCVIQSLNAVIAWRNLNLMRTKQASLKTTLYIFILSALTVSSLFLFKENFEWMTPPKLPWTQARASNASFAWHILGLFGMLLFASRFWVQWWLAEKHHKSYLGKAFWQISCAGALLCIAYFIRLLDVVNILGYAMGLIPYIRNLILLSRHKPLLSESKLFLFAGEQSGDLLGGKLIESLQLAQPSLATYGVGGPEMKKAGMKIFHPMERFQVMGITDVLKALPRLYSDFQKIKQEILHKNPPAVVLIDYPGFNLRLAKSLRKKGYRGKLIHYVCPSVWAWKKNRIKTLCKTLDHLLTILPFEKNCFTNTSLSVTYVGHPLVSLIDQYTYTPNFLPKKPLIAIFPGSRRHEIELNLPLQYQAAKKLGDHYTIAVSVAREEYKELIQSHTDAKVLQVPCDKRYELMRAADLALATSGTIILELGLHSVPTVVTYKLPLINYLLGRYLFRIRLPHYTLVNIICAKQVYPEFIHRTLSVDEIVKALEEFIQNPTPCQKECARLRELLASHDASQEAALTIQHEMSLL